MFRAKHTRRGLTPTSATAAAAILQSPFNTEPQSQQQQQHRTSPPRDDGGDVSSDDGGCNVKGNKGSGSNSSRSNSPPLLPTLSRHQGWARRCSLFHTLWPYIRLLYISLSRFTPSQHSPSSSPHLNNPLSLSSKTPSPPHSLSARPRRSPPRSFLPLLTPSSSSQALFACLPLMLLALLACSLGASWIGMGDACRDLGGVDLKVLSQWCFLRKASLLAEGGGDKQVQHIQGAGGDAHKVVVRVGGLAGLSGLQPASGGASSISNGSSSGDGEGNGEGVGSSGAERFYLLLSPSDRCVGVSHWKHSWLCAASEARALNRTWVLPFERCTGEEHALGRSKGEVVRPLQLYYDMEHLKRSTPVISLEDYERRFGPVPVPSSPSTGEYELRDERGRAVLQVDVGERTARLANRRDVHLIVRRFNWTSYGYEICRYNHLPRNYTLFQQHPYINRIVNQIAAAMQWDYDAVHVRRGDKVNPTLWPHLDNDTRPEALLKRLPRFIRPGRRLYIATNERTPGFFAPLRSLYNVSQLADYQLLWGPGSEWDEQFRSLVGRQGGEDADALMQAIVDYTVLAYAKKKVETFNDLTSDPREGVFPLPAPPTAPRATQAT